MDVERKDLFSAALICFTVAFLYYGRFLGNFFAFDDFRYLENIVQGPSAVLLGYNAQLRVVSNAAWYPLYLLSGYDPFGYNLFSIVLHGVNAVVLFFLCCRLFGRKGLAFLVAAVFVSTAAAADAVFWKMSLSTLLSAFFSLSALCLYVDFRQRRRRAALVLSVLAYVLAMFSKEDAASVPFLVVLIDLLFFGGGRDKKGVVVRVVPYGLVIVSYLAVTNGVYHAMGIASESGKFFQVRPLYSLLAGFSTFFIAPDGFLEMGNPAIYLTGCAVPLSLAFVRERKLLLFGYLWLLFAFLPTSLTSIASFQPRNFPNSISRLLYFSSIGASVVIGALLIRFRERFSARALVAACAVFFPLFLWLNGSRVWTRGEEWRRAGEPVAQFLGALQRKIPAFPPHAHVFVLNPPAGRAFVQQALRAFYRDPAITWIAEPDRYRPQAGENGFFIACSWRDDGVDLTVYQIR